MTDERMSDEEFDMKVDEIEFNFCKHIVEPATNLLKYLIFERERANWLEKENKECLEFEERLIAENKKLETENAELRKQIEKLEERGNYLQERFEENRNTTL